MGINKMRITRLVTIATLLFGVPALPSILEAQDVQNYSVGKTETLVQSSTATPTIESFGFTAIVNAENGGSLISAAITLPPGSTNPSPQDLGPDGNGGLVFNQGSATQAGLDAQFNNGTYGLNITGGFRSYFTSPTLTSNYSSPA